MIRHNLLLIYRNFLRAKGYFSINLIGLSTGLACTLLIYLWVRDELRMDTFHEKNDRIFEVKENQKYAADIMTTSSTPGILAENLAAEVPEVEFAVVTTWINPYNLSVKDLNINAKGYHVSKDFFNVFSYHLIQGNANQVLADKLAIVVSRELARKLFGTEDNAVGKVVEVQHKRPYHITGVFENTPSNSSLQFDFVRSFEEFKDENQWVLQWGNNGPSTYVALHKGTDAAVVSEKIKDYIKKKEKESNVTLFLQSYADTYLYGHFKNGKQAGGRIEYVRMFSVIAVFILLIACINFMNLSTARASRRAKEVGIKKSIGAQRRSLIYQYLGESVATAVLALVVAGLIVWMIIPQFNVLTDKFIRFSLLDGQMVGSFVAITVLTGLIAGSYPAIYLSGFKPAEVLKGMVRGSWGELFARRGLVIFQFFLAVILIVSVLVVYKQIEYVQSKNLGYKKEHLIMIPKEGRPDTSVMVFLEEVKRIPGVVNAAAIGSSLLGKNSNTTGLSWEGKNPDDRILFENVGASLGLIETLGLELADGRAFSSEFSTDTAKIVFNEAAIRVMGLQHPVGKVIKLWGHDREIIGVVKDFHFESLHKAVEPLYFVLNPHYTWNIMMRLEAGNEKETLGRLTDFYKTFNPGFSFAYKFQDQEYAKQYAAEQLVGSLSFYFATMAILISCLGLFGLAAFTAERRLKEIGIRKALGSSATNIVMLLSGDFTRMVLLSVFLGLPVGYWLLSGWLGKFAFHIELSAWYFALAGVIAIVIAWLTVAFQAIKAAGVNPVECLRSE